MASERSAAVGVLSSAIGWFYFACWCVTFWPQPLLNYQRKKVSGLSLEYVAYQFTGFFCYTLYSITSYILETRAASSDPSVSISVRPNDIAFTVHALLMTCVMMGQCVYYERTSAPRISPVHRYALFGLWTCLAFALLLAVTSSLPWACVLPQCPATQLTLLSTLGLTKVVINLIKNLPQLLLNYRRQSTVGWSIWGVWLDVAGASAAFVQQALDVWNLDDWGMMVGNVPKLLLSILSFVFDVAFLVQHHVCYRSSGGEEEEGEGEEETGDEENSGEAEAEEADSPAEMSPVDEEKEEGAETAGKGRTKPRKKLPWTGTVAHSEQLLQAGDSSVNGVDGEATPPTRFSP